MRICYLFHAPLGQNQVTELILCVIREDPSIEKAAWPLRTGSTKESPVGRTIHLANVLANCIQHANMRTFGFLCGALSAFASNKFSGCGHIVDFAGPCPHSLATNFQDADISRLIVPPVRIDADIDFLEAYISA